MTQPTTTASTTANAAASTTAKAAASTTANAAASTTAKVAASTTANRAAERKRLDFAADDGSTIPLVLGFFLIGLLMVAGAVMASDAYTQQRDLQSICDGAAIAAANSVDARAARTETLGGNLPLADVQRAAQTYLADDPGRAGVQLATTLSPDGRTVHAACRRHTKLAFGSIIGKSRGVDEHATASARSALG